MHKPRIAKVGGGPIAQLRDLQRSAAKLLFTVERARSNKERKAIREGWLRGVSPMNVHRCSTREIRAFEASDRERMARLDLKLHDATCLRCRKPRRCGERDCLIATWKRTTELDAEARARDGERDLVLVIMRRCSVAVEIARGHAR